MNHTATICALFLTGMVLTASAYAGTGINKCVGGSGQVTLTDEPCASGEQTVPVGSPATSADARVISVERFASSPMPVHYASVLKSAPPARGLSLDVATLKAARENMHLLDSAAQSMKSQRLAGLQ